MDSVQRLILRPNGRSSLSRFALVLFAACILSACGTDAPETSGPLSVPDGFTVEQVAGPDVVDFPTFAIFDENGRLFVIESTRANTMTTEEMQDDPHHRVKLLEDTDDDGIYDTSTVFADQLPFPEGGVWHQGSFYVAAAPDVIRFKDTDGDDVADEREVIATGWNPSVNGAVLSGPFVGPDGWLYLADARRGFDITTKEGEQLEGGGARIWRMRADGSQLESMVGGGFDNSIELVFTPAGETIGTMTYFVDPHAGQRDALMHWVEGGVYPKPHPVIREDDLTRTGELMPVMTKLARIAHSGLCRYENPHFGSDYAGNLFTAQFNTGRIMRHRMSRTGATFETTESRFLTSSDPDFHPTDVLTDADGSLLVVDTGGWFIKGCPLSQVAKPDIPGGIYRIRKTGGAEVDDPWGRSIDFEGLSPEDFVTYLSDERPKVRDRAIEALVDAGDSAVPPLEDLLQTSSSADVRTSAVFALYRIGSADAMRSVRASLSDRSPQVRNAAARSVGLAGDRRAVDRLMEMVQDDEAPVRRQAGTALGQIGDPAAVPALIKASEDPNDRFVEHAIIYALIELGETAPLVDALDESDPDVQTAALVALDQMEDSPLQADQAAPFLASDNPDLYETGVWVATHHPEWSDIVLEFLGHRLREEELSEGQRSSAAEVVISFCEDPGVQELVADLLENPSITAARKKLLLGTMNECPVDELPGRWVTQIGNLLRSDVPTVRTEALALIESRQVDALAGPLGQIVSDGQEPIDVRIEALGALTLLEPELSDREFTLVLEQLGPDAQAPVRQSATRILTQADLSEEQLQRLAAEYVPTVDPMVLSSLVGAFEGDSSEAAGHALVEALQQSPERLRNLSAADLDTLFAGYPAAVQKAARPVMETLREQQKNRLARLQEMEAQLTEGDVGNGREIFFGDKVICSSCHAVGGEGGDFGPDLTNIGEIRSPHDLLEAIMYPSVSFAREYETYQVETSATTHRGVLVEQTSEMVLLQTGQDSRVRISRSDIVSMQQGSTSMMPPGLDQALSTGELSDLMAFLESLPRASRLEGH